MINLNEYQIGLKGDQKKGFLLLAVGSAGGFVFLPMAFVAIYGLYFYWAATFKLMRSKCPKCGKNVGTLQPRTNYQCKSCSRIFIEPPASENGENQEKWFK